MSRLVALLSIWLVLASVATAYNRVYFLADNGKQPFGYRTLTSSKTNTVILVKDLSHKDDPVAPRKQTFQTITFSDSMLMGFALGRDSENNSNLLKGIRTNTSGAPESYCHFSENYLARDDVLSVFEVNETLIISTYIIYPNRIRLHSVPLSQFSSFQTSFSCSSTYFSQFTMPTGAGMTPNVLGSYFDPDTMMYTFLEENAGLVIVNATEFYAPPPSSYSVMNPQAMASQPYDDGSFFIATYQPYNGSNQTVIMRMNTSGASDILGVFPESTQLNMAYDANSRTIVFQTEQNVSIYNETGHLINSWVIQEEYSNWLSMYYHSGPERPYCPRNCYDGQGKCVNNSCVCSPGFIGEDCSACEDSYCHGHGKCRSQGGNRRCDCVQGWDGDTCDQCDSLVLCSPHGHGVCDNNDKNGRCICEKGFSGSDCSTCDAKIVCNANGQCTQNGTCACVPLWSGDDCSIRVRLPLDSSLTLMNYIVMTVWAFMFLIALFCLLLRGFTPFAYANGFLSPGIHFSTVYFQSFVLLLYNGPLQEISYIPFHYFSLFLADFKMALGLSEIIYIESMSFMPKIALFVIACIIWVTPTSARTKGNTLQLFIWFHMLLLVSVVLRIGQFECQDCPKWYTWVSTLSGIACMIALAYWVYRLWRVIKQHEPFIREDMHYAPEEQIKTTWKRYLHLSFDFFFSPWSHALSFVLERLTPVALCNLHGNDVTPNLTRNNSRTSLASEVNNNEKSEMDTPVDQLVARAARRIDHPVEDTRFIVSMLKGNWYNTAADLKTLTVLDAKKLNIPYRLFKAIQSELPQTDNDETRSHVALDPLVKTVHREQVQEEYGCLFNHLKPDYLLFTIDELITRNFIWILIVVLLSTNIQWQLPCLLAFQTWWVMLLVWNRPYKRTWVFLCKLLTELGTWTILIALIILSGDIYGRYKSCFMGIVIVHVIVVLTCFFLPPCILSIERKQYRAVTSERQPLKGGGDSRRYH
ncbi:hypothetical protein PROFUN_04963 [Planoprotostelium fungivorum]|uniref:EGF-like domain-containing protein n=1 Tax=Planoprotostelium fungivorum TaxID=1890364 RepID=A0A2P6NSP3_9EUKA|nr:hypothetical protein PROFUN_04963 [Planoprotostelium fungivorum]